VSTAELGYALVFDLLAGKRGIGKYSCSQAGDVRSAADSSLSKPDLAGRNSLLAAAFDFRLATGPELAARLKQFNIAPKLSGYCYATFAAYPAEGVLEHSQNLVSVLLLDVELPLLFGQLSLAHPLLRPDTRECLLLLELDFS
jgi:hypothetical protein